MRQTDDADAATDRPKHDEHRPLKVEDRRHWARERDETEESGEEAATSLPTVVDEFRRRAEAAEGKLLEYIAAFKQAQLEQDQFRERLSRDVERRVDLRFGEMLEPLLGCLHDLDLALEHVRGVAEAAELARGVALVRDRFLAVLERAGVTRLEPAGCDFDPNVAEAARVDAVDDPLLDGKVTVVLRPGYRLGERVLQPARVAVGRSRA